MRFFYYVILFTVDQFVFYSLFLQNFRDFLFLYSTGEVPYAAVEEWMDVDAFLKDELKVCRVKEEEHLDTLPDSVTFSCSASTEHQSWLVSYTILEF